MFYSKPSIPKSPFKSFWMAGYECSDKLNAFGNRVDFLNITRHFDFIYEDYSLLRDFNITTVREGIRWSFVEKQPYKYDFSVVAEMIKAAKYCGIQQVWDLCHFGFPDDLTPLHPKFARRFAASCTAFLEFYRSINSSETLVITPINEVSFISWLGGEACGTAPYCNGFGWQVKYKLMKAYIEGVAALKSIDDNVMILSSEPLVNMVPPENATEEQIINATIQHQHQFQAMDILCGRVCPELNGDPDYLDIIGLNYYYNNQWISGTTNFLGWGDEPKDVRWRPLSSLVTEVYERYNKPLAITETSHPKEHRPNWITDITEQLANILNNNIPLTGVCIYPIIDRPDWDNLVTWHNSGLWDIQNVNGVLKRVLHEPFATALLQSQQKLNNFVKHQEPESVDSLWSFMPAYQNAQ
ncbi:MAG: amine oxidase [Parafilimonas sp.]|nr:amine oxidase [Parafilimonas sp.]